MASSSKPKPSSAATLSMEPTPMPSSGASPSEPVGPPPAKRPRRKVDIDVAFAEEAVGEPLEVDSLAHNSIILGAKYSPHEPELVPFFGMYHRIGLLNGKPIWKSQHQSFASNGFSPDETAFVWYSRACNNYFLSKHCFNEESGEDPFWAYIDVKMLMSEDLFDWCAYPWNSPDSYQGVQWRSFYHFACDKMFEYMVANNNLKEETIKVTSELMASQEELIALKAASLETADDAEDEGADAPGGESSGSGFPPNPPRVLPAVPPLADELRDTSPKMTLPSGLIINRPPAPPASHDMGPYLPSIKKTGYMAKLCAMMVANDMNLGSRVSELRTTFLDVARFKALYDSHRDMMERTGLDHRFVFP